MTVGILAAIVGLTAGNCLYVYWHGNSYAEAFERSYFQAFAIILYAWIT